MFVFPFFFCKNEQFSLQQWNKCHLYPHQLHAFAARHAKYCRPRALRGAPSLALAGLKFAIDASFSLRCKRHFGHTAQATWHKIYNIKGKPAGEVLLEGMIDNRRRYVLDYSPPHRYLRSLVHA